MKFHKKKTSKPTWFHFINKDDFEVQIKRKKIKYVSKQKSIFKAFSLELKTVLKILQENDTFAKEK